MPSFVSEVAFDVTTNWESLSEPGRTKRGYEELIGEGCQLQQLRKCLAEKNCISECREGDVARLDSRLDQLEQMLSLQTYRVSVPYEHDQPFNRIFNEGENSLKPKLYGFHGLHYLVPPQMKSDSESSEFKAEFFLTGRNFHPTLTHVIIGGHESDSASSYSDKSKDPEVEILSRELIRVQVTIKTDLMNAGDKFEVRVGTPGGMSGPVEIAAYKKKETSEQ